LWRGKSLRPELPVKLLVFAHKPPPHHGQSYMVELLLKALGGDARQRMEIRRTHVSQTGIDCYHVDARYSTSSVDIGQARWGKVLLAFKFSLEAIWCRFRWGVESLYFVPAFPARAPIYRDWIVLLLCRPFFKRTIYHWHAVGLGEWLAREARPWERWISRRILPKPDLSIVLRPFNRTDAEQLESKRIEVVPNGIPDPCPDFEKEVLPRRLARAEARKKLLAGKTLDAGERLQAGADVNTFRLLFVGTCYSGKGLFDSLEAVALAQQKLSGSSLRVSLTVVGKFWIEAEQAEFERRIRKPDLQVDDQPLVDYRGFVAGADKHRLFIESDCLCFPTRMPESFGLVLVEGMAFGLSLITTNWRNIPEMLPPHPPGIVEPKSPEQIASAVVSYLGRAYDPSLRAWFLSHYTEQEFAENMRRTLASLDRELETRDK
jgi:glycosyltransferase involved in cell wall biosynthesis